MRYSSKSALRADIRSAHDALTGLLDVIPAEQPGRGRIRW